MIFILFYQLTSSFLKRFKMSRFPLVILFAFILVINTFVSEASEAKSVNDENQLESSETKRGAPKIFIRKIPVRKIRNSNIRRTEFPIPREFQPVEVEIVDDVGDFDKRFDDYGHMR